MKLTPEPESGESIHRVAERACVLAHYERQEVEFTFNGEILRVNPRSFPDDIAEIYSLKAALSRANK